MKSGKLWYIISTMVCIIILTFSLVIKGNLIWTYSETEYE